TTEADLDKLMNSILAFENCKENYMNLYNADFSVNNDIDIIGNDDNRTSKVETFEAPNTSETSNTNGKNPS
ncbi:35268_t:CDS:1, partial [Gigaspora margarita]